MIAAMTTSTMFSLLLFLALPALLSLWALMRDLHDDSRLVGTSGRLPPRSHRDEEMTRSQVLATLSR